MLFIYLFITQLIHVESKKRKNVMCHCRKAWLCRANLSLLLNVSAIQCVMRLIGIIWTTQSGAHISLNISCLTISDQSSTWLNVTHWAFHAVVTIMSLPQVLQRLQCFCITTRHYHHEMFHWLHCYTIFLSHGPVTCYWTVFAQWVSERVKMINT